MQVEGTIEVALVREQLERTLGLSAGVDVLPAGSILRSEGKALRVVDRRPA